MAAEAVTMNRHNRISVILAAIVYPLHAIAASVIQGAGGLSAWAACLPYVNYAAFVILLASFVLGIIGLRGERISLFWLIPLALYFVCVLASALA